MPKNASPDRKTQIFTLIVILSNVLGNLALTWGMKHGVAGFSASPLMYLKAFSNPFVFLGIGLLIVWMLSRMTLLSWADLSYVLPVTSLGYVLNAILGRWFFDEKVTPARWLGTILIMAGIALVGATAPRSTTDTAEPQA